jgi:hypothetical protein
VDANRGLRRLGTVPAGDRTRGPGLVLVGAHEALRHELADAIVGLLALAARVLRAEPDGRGASAHQRRLRAARRALTWRTARERGELVIADGDDALGRRGPPAPTWSCRSSPGAGLSMRLEGPDLVELDAGLSVAALRRVVTEVVCSRWAQRSLPADLQAVRGSPDEPLRRAGPSPRAARRSPAGRGGGPPRPACRRRRAAGSSASRSGAASRCSLRTSGKAKRNFSYRRQERRALEAQRRRHPRRDLERVHRLGHGLRAVRAGHEEEPVERAGERERLGAEEPLGRGVDVELAP